MRGFFLSGLGLALGCLVAHAQADEVQWRPVGPRQAVSGNPATAAGSAPTVSSGKPAVMLRPPIPLGSEPTLDPDVRPIVYTQPSFTLVRSQAPDGAKPLPTGSSAPGGFEPLPLPRSADSTSSSAPLASSDAWGSDFTPLAPSGPMPDGIVSQGVPGDGLLGSDSSCGCGVDSGSCGCGDAFNSCCGCGLPGRRLWFSAEYLLWSLRSVALPPLVTSTTLSPGQLAALAAADPAFNPGGVAQPGTTTLFGSNNVNYNPFSGGRFTIGTPGPWGNLGLEATFFFLGQQGQNFTASSGGDPFLFRPFFNANTGLNDAELTAVPGLLAGSVTAAYSTSLWGAEANGRLPMWCDGNCKFDLLGGFRYLDLTEHLNIRESVTELATIPAAGQVAGNTFALSDNFGTLNHFFGGQIGGDFEWRWNRFFVDTNAKIALGAMHQVVNVNGETTFIAPSGSVVSTQPGGLLAQPSNSGHFHRNQFAVVPELGFKVGYQVTDHMRAYVGYTFLYASSVVRPAEQVDLHWNTTQLPSSTGPGVLVGQAVPAVLFKATDFWAQGVNFGMEWRY